MLKQIAPKSLYLLGLCLAGSALKSPVVHAQGTLESAGTMTIARDAHAALLVGDKVLVIGGRTNTSGITTTRTDFYRGAFNATGSMAGSRSFFPPVLLDNGKVLAAGGFRKSTFSQTIRTSELFDPVAGTWSTTGSLGTARELHTATKLADGRVLVAGGLYGGSTVLRSAEIYNPARGRFSTTGSMSYTRFGHTKTLLNGKVLVTGGRTANNVSHKTTEWYSPSSGTWSAGPSMNFDRYRHTATTLKDGRILITGGYSSTRGHTLPSAEIYDPNTNTFEKITQETYHSETNTYTLTPGTGMSDGRMDHTATLLKDGRVLITGGWSSVKTSTVASVDLFDPATNSFTALSPLPFSRHEHTATLLPSGAVLIAGGLQWEPVDKKTLSDAYLYWVN